MTVGLIGGRDDNEGTVQVTYPYVGGIGKMNFDNNDAKVVCRMLGKPSVIRFGGLK